MLIPKKLMLFFKNVQLGLNRKNPMTQYLFILQQQWGTITMPLCKNIHLVLNMCEYLENQQHCMQNILWDSQ